MRDDREGRAHVHAATVAFHRGVDKLLHLGEGDNFINLLPDFRADHAEDRTV